MKKSLTFLTMLMAMAMHAFAQTPATRPVRIMAALAEEEGIECYVRHAPRIEKRERLAVSLLTAKPGELKDRLGANINSIDALSVEGPINEKDYEAMWSASFYGVLKEIDLSKAVPESDLLPNNAFFKKEIQYDKATGNIRTICLEKIVLPAGIRELGNFAFAYAAAMKDIVLPEKLEKIGEAAFTDCNGLTYDPFVLPANLKFIGYQAFYRCKGLHGEVVLPPSIEVIDGGAFYQTKITKINFPESLTWLGMFAFHGCNLQGDITLPDNCELDCRGDQFASNWKLKSVHLPKNCTIIPEGIFNSCYELERVTVPAGVTTIEMDAFQSCLKLKAIELPEGLTAILEDAFCSCVSIKEIVLPSTMRFLGGTCFNNTHISSVVCKSQLPPTCAENQLAPGKVPLGSLSAYAPVYIPAGSKQTYREAWGWNHFANLIETDFSGVDDIAADNADLSAPLYNVMGVKVDHPLPGNLYIRNGKKFVQPTH